MATHELEQASSPSSRPRFERVESLIPVEDYELRLALIEDIRKVSQRFRGPKKPDLTGLEFSYLINMPLDRLRNLKGLLPVSSTTLQPLINDLGNATWWFLQKTAYKIEFPKESQDNSSTKAVSAKGKAPQRVSSQGSITKPGSSSKSHASGRRSATGLLEAIANASVGTSKDTEIDRSGRLREECLDLDGHYCVVTGASHPHVCHIVPFSWSKNEKNVGFTNRFISALELVIDLQSDDLQLAAMSKLREGVGCTDRLWNLVCLSPQLLKWWDHSYFGLKYYDRNDSVEEGFVEIHLQFVWMPRNISQQATKQININQQADRSTGLSAGLSHHYGDQTTTPCSKPSCNDCQAIRRVKAYDLTTNRPVVSGQIIVVKRRKEHAPLFEAMIKIQWAVIRAAAISGGALAPDELRSFSEGSDGGEADVPTGVEEEDPIATAKRIHDWLDHI